MSFSLFLTRLYLCFCLSVFATVVSPLAVANDDIKQYLQPIPVWVVPFNVDFDAPVPIEKIQDGVFYRYVGNQMRVTDNDDLQRHYRYTETLANKKGLDKNSQINLSFDPSYQKLHLNTLNLIRNGQVINKLNQAKISIFDNEDELDSQIYNGSLTLNILFDDLEVGDTIDYSYTRIGANPIYQDIFAFSRTLNWSVPVYDQQIRVLWGKSTPLYVKGRNIDLEMKQTQLGIFQEYTLNQHNVDTINIAGELPNWYSPYAEVLFTESKSWQDVVNWAKPLYDINRLSPAIVDVAEQLNESANNNAEKIVAALNYTQQKIRYVGLEMGVNSHKPTPAEETLELKYGDCKDKALFLIHVLKAMGISAYPALVDTEETKLLNERPAAVNRFDHVIVTLMHNDKRYWLDPTISYQQGRLDDIYQPDYGYAVILQEGQDALTPMASEQINSTVNVTENFLINEDPLKAISFDVTTTYSGYEAQSKRSQLERDGINELSKDYEVYYQGIYAGLEAKGDVEAISDSNSGMMTFNESYLINNYWEKEESGYEASYYPYDIRNTIYKPEQIKRESPATYPYPKRINYTTILTFEEDGWDFDDEDFLEDNDVFYFKSSGRFADNVLTLSYEYYSKSDHIPADKMEQYLESRDRVRDKAYFGIIKYIKADKPANDLIDFSAEKVGYVLFVFVYLLGVIYFIIRWCTESKDQPVQEDGSGAKKHGLRWHLRNIVAVVLFTPLVVISVGVNSILMPSTAVVEGSKVHKNDMNFLYRKDVIKASESLHYFYSAAIFSVRDDGNGFTDSTVFSYWDDEDGFQKENAKYEDIDQIDVKFSGSMLEDTIITITRLDGSDFLLFVSAEDAKDKVFVSKLKALWEAKNPDT